MSNFILCDGSDCNGNEGSSDMYAVSKEASRILVSAGYGWDSIEDLCDECIMSIVKDAGVNKKIYISEFDEVTEEKEDDNVRAKDYKK